MCIYIYTYPYNTYIVSIHNMVIYVWLNCMDRYYICIIRMCIYIHIPRKSCVYSLPWILCKYHSLPWPRQSRTTTRDHAFTTAHQHGPMGHMKIDCLGVENETRMNLVWHVWRKHCPILFLSSIGTCVRTFLISFANHARAADVRLSLRIAKIKFNT